MVSEWETDWRQLHIDIVRQSRKANGLRKRGAVWDDCQYILVRIEFLRNIGRTGKIRPHKTREMMGLRAQKGSFFVFVENKDASLKP